MARSVPVTDDSMTTRGSEGGPRYRLSVGDAVPELDQERLVREERVAASLVETILGYVMRYTFGDDLGKLTNDYLDNGVPVLLRLLPDNNNAWFDDTTTAARETRDDILRRSFTDALADLQKRLGKFGFFIGCSRFDEGDEGADSGVGSGAFATTMAAWMRGT